MPARVAAARAAQAAWAGVEASRRCRVVGGVRHRIAARATELAEAIVAPNRGLAERMVSEVVPLAAAARHVARSGPRLLRSRRVGALGRPIWLWGATARVERVPLGVVAILAPSNYPLLLAGAQAMQALAAGNAVIVKPAPGHERPMRLLGEMLIEAGVPVGVFAVAEGGAEAARDLLAAGVDKVILTGSAETGRAVLGQLAGSLTPATMELSGCDAAIVLSGADVDLAARSLAYGLCLNGGATCIAPRRVLVEPSVAEALEKRLVELLADVPAMAVAPAAAERIVRAVGGGGRLLVGQAPAAGATRLRPTVVADVPEGSALLNQDLFGPVMSLIRVGSVDEAVRRANASPYALGASVFGPSGAARAVAARLDVGVVTINDLIVPTADPRLPFGGGRSSGFGVTRGDEGLIAMTRPKVMSLRRGKARPHLRPPRPVDAEVFAGYLELTHGRGWRARFKGLVRIVAAGSGGPPMMKDVAEAPHAGGELKTKP